MAGADFLLAGCRPWDVALVERLRSETGREWAFARESADLDPARVRALDPEILFFVHWSWIVPPEITEGFECVGFHMGDLPRDRGGSPLQNLILSGRRETWLNALRLVRELDAGPVYLRERLSLEGGAEEIYLRQTRLTGDLILRFLRERPAPVPQEGEPSVFRRRRPAESRVPGDLVDLPALHDFIRMLDADGYPAAFLETGGFRFELRRSTLYHDRIEATVSIRPTDAGR